MLYIQRGYISGDIMCLFTFKYSFSLAVNLLSV